MTAGKGTTIIIKRISRGEDAGHHGGAWKVAYADFVTAMMAFFLLMWLLNATTEEQRTGLADYFNPTIVHMSDTAGDGNDNGKRVVEGVSHANIEDIPDTSKAGEFEQIAKQVQDHLTGSGAESSQMQNILLHVVTRMTDEGLVIELSDLVGEPLFEADTAQARPVLIELSRVVSRALARTTNDLAVSGHVRAYPEMFVNSPVWALSDARAHTVRNLLETEDLPSKRFQRVTSYGDRKNRNGNPMAPANNRVEIILLR